MPRRSAGSPPRASASTPSWAPTWAAGWCSRTGPRRMRHWLAHSRLSVLPATRALVGPRRANEKNEKQIQFRDCVAVRGSKTCRRRKLNTYLNMFLGVAHVLKKRSLNALAGCGAAGAEPLKQEPTIVCTTSCGMNTWRAHTSPITLKHMQTMISHIATQQYVRHAGVDHVLG